MLIIMLPVNHTVYGANVRVIKLLFWWLTSARDFRYGLDIWRRPCRPSWLQMGTVRVRARDFEGWWIKATVVMWDSSKWRRSVLIFFLSWLAYLQSWSRDINSLQPLWYRWVAPFLFQKSQSWDELIIFRTVELFAGNHRSQRERESDDYLTC